MVAGPSPKRVGRQPKLCRTELSMPRSVDTQRFIVRGSRRRPPSIMQRCTRWVHKPQPPSPSWLPLRTTLGAACSSLVGWSPAVSGSIGVSGALRGVQESPVDPARGHRHRRDPSGVEKSGLVVMSGRMEIACLRVQIGRLLSTGCRMCSQHFDG